MRITDVFGMCLRNLYKRKLRTLLTLLGVMIGTGSIILMISLGLATDAQFAQMIEEMNLDMTAITVRQQWGGMMWDGNSMTQMEQGDPITGATVDRISRIPGVLVATPVMEAWVALRSGPYAMNARVTGIRPEALPLMGYNLEYGRLLENDDEFAVVFSYHSERMFFDTTADMWWGGARLWEEDPDTYVDIYNDTIRLYYDESVLWRSQIGGDDDFGIDFEEAFTPVRSFDLDVVGVLESSEDMWGGFSTTIYMNIETLHTLHQFAAETQRRQQEQGDWMWGGGVPHFSATQGEPRENYDQLFVRSSSMEITSEVAEQIRTMGYQVSFSGEHIERQREMQRGIETLLAAIAAVSLLVAAINIANTMITSVTERTKEIGVMKVIGASISDVLRLFLTEAVFIGFLGGIFGIGLALGASYAMNNFDIEFLRNLNMGAPIAAEGASISLITPWLCGVALAVAAGVGVISGFYPAWRATRLSALAAIRGD